MYVSSLHFGIIFLGILCCYVRAEKSRCSILDGIFTNVVRRIYNQGFHKELSTEIELMLTTSVLPDQCRVVVEETLPTGTFVDPDELKEHYVFRNLHTYIAGTVNIEAPEWVADSFRLFIFKALYLQDNLRLANISIPIHLRYHKPVIGGSNQISNKQLQKQVMPGLYGPNSLIKIANPRLFLFCEDQDFSATARLCPKIKAAKFFCDFTASTKCRYLPIPYKINVEQVEVSVPVGNLNHGPFVTGITTFFVCASAIYLLGALFRPVAKTN